VLAFEARAPRFEGAVTLASPLGRKDSGTETPPRWRITSRVKADPAAARLDALEMTYGAEERALKLSGNGELRFGASPLLRAALSARQLDADKFFARESNSKDNAAEPVRVLPALRALMSGIPMAPIAAQIELASEQVMLGGRPLQDIAAELRGDGTSWRIGKLDFRAPGTTRVLLSEASACHDEAAFPDARSFVADRSPNRHPAFGLGIHRCPGSHLARLEFAEIQPRHQATALGHHCEQRRFEHVHGQLRVVRARVTAAAAHDSTRLAATGPGSELNSRAIR
jgi:hypothetical protein